MTMLFRVSVWWCSFFNFRNLLQGCGNGDVNTVCVIFEWWYTAAITGPLRLQIETSHDDGIDFFFKKERNPANSQRASPGGTDTQPTFSGLLSWRKTTYLLWQLVARSSRASRCLCSNPAAAECLLLPVDLKIICFRSSPHSHHRRILSSGARPSWTCTVLG